MYAIGMALPVFVMDFDVSVNGRFEFANVGKNIPV